MARMINGETKWAIVAELHIFNPARGLLQIHLETGNSRHGLRNLGTRDDLYYERRRGEKKAAFQCVL